MDAADAGQQRRGLRQPGVRKKLPGAFAVLTSSPFSPRPRLPPYRPRPGDSADARPPRPPRNRCYSTIRGPWSGRSCRRLSLLREARVDLVLMGFPFLRSESNGNLRPRHRLIQ